MLNGITIAVVAIFCNRSNLVSVKFHKHSKSTKLYDIVFIKINTDNCVIQIFYIYIYYLLTYWSNSESCISQYPVTVVIWTNYFYFCLIYFNIYLLIDRLNECILKHDCLSSRTKHKLPLSSFIILSHWTSLFFGAPLIVCIILSTYKSLPNLFLQRFS